MQCFKKKDHTQGTGNSFKAPSLAFWLVDPLLACHAQANGKLSPEGKKIPTRGRGASRIKQVQAHANGTGHVGSTQCKKVLSRFFTSVLYNDGMEMVNQ